MATKKEIHMLTHMRTSDEPALTIKNVSPRDIRFGRLSHAALSLKRDGTSFHVILRKLTSKA